METKLQHQIPAPVRRTDDDDVRITDAGEPRALQEAPENPVEQQTAEER